MEKLVAELKRMFRFKDETLPGDLVVVAAKEPQLLVYALVGGIERDQSRRAEWWHLSLHLLGMPIQSVVWTLREPQFTGKEIFTMGGNPHFIKAVSLPSGTDPEEEESGTAQPKTARTTRLIKVK